MLNFIFKLNKKFYFLIGNYVIDIFDKTLSIQIKNKKIYIYIPNQLNFFRAKTFFSKEPETIKWIEDFGKNSVFFDIGANIGLYSIYHSYINNAETFAFEPSFVNLKLLLKNISINDLNSKISVISNPLSNKNLIQDFNYTSLIEGGAISTFGENYSYDGNFIKFSNSIKKLGFTIDYLVENKILPQPNIIKIDVDGIEHLILDGAKKVISNSKCKSILVEINDSFYEQKNRCESILKEAKFKILQKEQSIFTKKNKGFEKTYNQIWVKI